MPVQVACPTCKRLLSLGEQFLGKTVKCPLCNAMFATRAPQSSAPPLPPPPPKPPEFAFPNLQLDDEPSAPPAPRPVPAPPPPPPPQAKTEPADVMWVEPVEEEPVELEEQPREPRRRKMRVIPKGERPAYLFGLAAVPFGIPFLASITALVLNTGFAGFLRMTWGLAFLLGGVCLLVAMVASWPVVARAVGSLALSGFGYAILIAGVAFNANREDATWRDFSPPGGGFRVRMPGQPKGSTTNSGLFPDARADLSLYTTQLPKQRLTYQVGYCNAPQGFNAAAFLEQYPDREVQREFPGGFVTDASPIRFGNLQGRELQIELRNGGRVVRRVYATPRRVYLQTVSGNVFSRHAPEVRKFFDLFQLTGPF